MTMKYFISKLLLSFILLLTTIIQLYAKWEVAEQIVAIVDNEPILLSDVNSYLQYYFMYNKIDIRMLTEEDFKQYQKKALENLINSKVLVKEAERESLNVNSDKISQEVDKQIDQLINQFGSKDKFVEALKSQGMDIVDFRTMKFNQIKEQMLEYIMKNKLRSELSITKDMIIEFYNTHKDSFPAQDESYRLSIYKTPIYLEGNRKKILYDSLSTIRQKIVSGKLSFEEAAKLYSQGPMKDKGGDLGFVKKGDLIPELEKVAFALDIDSISPIIETNVGLHLLKVIDRDKDRVRLRHIVFLFNITEKDIKYSKLYLDSLINLVYKDTTLSLESLDSSIKKIISSEWIKYKDLQPQFQQAIEELKIDSLTYFPKYTRPILLDKNFYILEILDYKPKRYLSLKDDWNIIEEKAREYYLQKYFEDKLREWKKNFYIEVRMK